MVEILVFLIVALGSAGFLFGFGLYAQQRRRANARRRPRRPLPTDLDEPVWWRSFEREFERYCTASRREVGSDS